MRRTARRPAAREAGALDPLSLRNAVQAQVGRVVVDQVETVDRMIAAFLVGGHVLLEGVPGTAKTLTARAVGAALDLSFGRVQCTPDLLPSDVTGNVVLRDGTLTFRPGPVFVNLLLVDELNRTPPKTQAALLEAMQERQVTVDATTRPLPEPFLVVATQNPIEQEGTYPLPEAQLDRFHVRVLVGYPDPAAEEGMLRLAHRGVEPLGLADVQAVAGAADIAAARAVVDATHVSEPLFGYVAGIVQATRRAPLLRVGASPRAAVHLLAATKAHARLRGRDYVTPDDVAAVATSVLAHRVVLRPEAAYEGVTDADAIRTAGATVPVPR